ncbi:uncharacterized protein FYW61_017227 [Anableps anableps]
MKSAMVTRSSCAPWSHLDFVWLSIFWFTFAVNISVTHCKKLDTEPKVLTTCGANATLTCNASTSVLEDSKIIKFVWQSKNTTLCQYEENNSTSKYLCNSTRTASEFILTLTILDIIPADEGVYHCKLHSTRVAANGQSQVRIEDCLGRAESSMDKNFAECSFDKVFPSGEVHWYQGDLNLTDASETEENQDNDGYYKVQSKVPTKKGSQSQPYNCSLWMPSVNRYLSSQLVVSSGSTGQLHWICIMMGILKIIIM